MFGADTKREEDGKQHAADEHEFRCATDTLAAWRHCQRLGVLFTFHRDTSPGHPFRQPTEREPTPRAEPHLLRALLLTTIRTIHKLSGKQFYPNGGKYGNTRNNVRSQLDFSTDGIRAWFRPACRPTANRNSGS